MVGRRGVIICGGDPGGSGDEKGEGGELAKRSGEVRRLSC